eukprot:SAG31_NODE_358_length_17033_cov_11.747077_15_plen_790_part_00
MGYTGGGTKALALVDSRSRGSRLLVAAVAVAVGLFSFGGFLGSRWATVDWQLKEQNPNNVTAPVFSTQDGVNATTRANASVTTAPTVQQATNAVSAALAGKIERTEAKLKDAFTKHNKKLQRSLQYGLDHMKEQQQVIAKVEGRIAVAKASGNTLLAASLQHGLDNMVRKLRLENEVPLASPAPHSNVQGSNASQPGQIAPATIPAEHLVKTTGTPITESANNFTNKKLSAVGSTPTTVAPPPKFNISAFEELKESLASKAASQAMRMEQTAEEDIKKLDEAAAAKMQEMDSVVGSMKALATSFTAKLTQTSAQKTAKIDTTNATQQPNSTTPLNSFATIKSAETAIVANALTLNTRSTSRAETNKNQTAANTANVAVTIPTTEKRSWQKHHKRAHYNHENERLRFPQPSDKRLRIDLDPDKDPGIFDGANFEGVGCHRFSLNDGYSTIGDTKIDVFKHSNIKVVPAYPGGISQNMIQFVNKYCDIPRGKNADRGGHDGSACYRSEWTMQKDCRPDYVPVQGELWFGFSMFIPENVGRGLKEDKKFLSPEKPGHELLMSSKFTRRGKEPCSGVSCWEPNVFGTDTRNWLDLFQIHHGGYGGHKNPRGVQGREPLVALTLMDGEYYTMMLSGSDKHGTRTTTIDRIAEAHLGQWEYFVYHTVLSSDPNKGLAELWRNGEKIVHRTNLVTQYDTDTFYPYPKFGVYADSWKYHRRKYANTKLEAGFGAFRMGGPEATYDDVCIHRCGPNQSHQSRQVSRMNTANMSFVSKDKQIGRTRHEVRMASNQTVGN